MNQEIYNLYDLDVHRSLRLELSLEDGSFQLFVKANNANDDTSNPIDFPEVLNAWDPSQNKAFKFTLHKGRPLAYSQSFYNGSGYESYKEPALVFDFEKGRNKWQWMLFADFQSIRDKPFYTSEMKPPTPEVLLELSDHHQLEQLLRMYPSLVPVLITLSDLINTLAGKSLSGIAAPHAQFASYLLSQPKLLSKLNEDQLYKAAVNHEFFIMTLLDYPEFLLKISGDNLCHIGKFHENFWPEFLRRGFLSELDQPNLSVLLNDNVFPKKLAVSKSDLKSKFLQLDNPETKQVGSFEFIQHNTHLALSLYNAHTHADALLKNTKLSDKDTFDQGCLNAINSSSNKGELLEALRTEKKRITAGIFSKNSWPRFFQPSPSIQWLDKCIKKTEECPIVVYENSDPQKNSMNYTVG